MAIDPNELTPTGGFMAISPPVPTGPLAIRKLVRGLDGTMQTIMVDARTNQPIADPSGYNIVENGNYLDPTALQQVAPTTPKEEDPSVSQEIIQDRAEGGDRGLADPRDTTAGNFNRDITNNYGYVNKPGFMSFANFMPGPLGLAAKAANVGLNVNNTMATNEARSMLGLDNTAWGTAKGAFRDKHGQVADVNIGKNTYSVGFEALSPTGQTNLTPNEARARSLTTGLGLKEATTEEAKANLAKMEREVHGSKKNTGLVSKTYGFAKDLIGSIFGTPAAAAQNQFPSASKSGPRGFGGGSLGDRGYDGSSYSGNNAGQDTPSETGGASLGSGAGRGGFGPGGGGETGASSAEADRGGGGVSSGGTGLW